MAFTVSIVRSVEMSVSRHRGCQAVAYGLTALATAQSRG
jgi:hypothetical protein